MWLLELVLMKCKFERSGPRNYFLLIHVPDLAGHAYNSRAKHTNTLKANVVFAKQIINSNIFKRCPQM